MSELYTTSDDRSVRFWTLKRNPESQIDGHALKLTSFGHTGRVFRSALTTYRGNSYLFTIGEDSRICCWDMEGHLKFRRESHAGCTLWGIAIGQNPQVIYLTTSNGGLGLLCMEECFQEETEVKCISKNLFHDCYPTKIRFLSASNIICLTNDNTLHMLRLSNGSWVVVAYLGLGFKSTILEIFSDLIAVGGNERIQVYKSNGTRLELLAESQGVIKRLVRAVHWISVEQVLVVNDVGDGILFSASLKPVAKLSMPKCKEPWSTSVLLLNDHLLVADRQGHLSIFDCRGSGGGELIQASLRMTLRRVHGNLGITDMKALSRGRFITAGHDGMIRTHRLEEPTGHIEMVRSQKVPIKWIEKVDEDLVFGFNDDHFTIFSPENKHILKEINCGGGHRFWDFMRNGSEGQFLFIKNRQLQLVTTNLQPLGATFSHAISHWHINSTNCLHSWCVQAKQYLISGGEEGLLKIHELRANSLIFRDELTTHISNIRSIFVCQLNDEEIFLFSAGGRAQLCIHGIRAANGSLEIRECVNFMLKSSDLDRRKNKNNVVDFDPETRFMSLFVDGGKTIYVGCSDGYIRVLEFDDTHGELTLVSENFYGRCILHITEIVVGGHSFLVTVATDGLINFWQKGMQDGSTAIFRLSHHESGINGFDWRPLSEDSFWVVTGGDDQAIVGSIVYFIKDTMTFSSSLQLKCPFRHTAQVTGIKFINDTEFLSVGVDQQVLKNSVENVKMYETVRYSSVADVKGLSLVSNSQAVVYGCGVDVFDL